MFCHKINLQIIKSINFNKISLFGRILIFVHAHLTIKPSNKKIILALSKTTKSIKEKKIKANKKIET